MASTIWNLPLQSHVKPESNALTAINASNAARVGAACVRRVVMTKVHQSWEASLPMDSIWNGEKRNSPR